MYFNYCTLNRNQQSSIIYFLHIVFGSKKTVEMTKLLEWLIAGGLFLSVWISLITNVFQSTLINEWMQIVVLPILVVRIFGVSKPLNWKWLAQKKFLLNFKYLVSYLHFSA